MRERDCGKPPRGWWTEVEVGVAITHDRNKHLNHWRHASWQIIFTRPQSKSYQIEHEWHKRTIWRAAAYLACRGWRCDDCIAWQGKALQKLAKLAVAINRPPALRWSPHPSSFQVSTTSSEHLLYYIKTYMRLEIHLTHLIHILPI